MDYLDEEYQRKLRVEEFLRKHHKITAPVLIAVFLAFFILPWVFGTFLTALGIQVLGCFILYVLGRHFTTAFQKHHPTEDDEDNDRPE